MAKTLKDVRDHVRVYLDEVSAADWTDAQINRAINNAYLDHYTDVVMVYEDYYSTNALTGTVAGQQEYALPDDFYKIRRVELNYEPSNPNAISNRAVKVTIDDVLRDLGNQGLSLTPHSRPGYYIRGNNIGFIPIPTETGDNCLSIWYITTIDDLSVDSDTLNLPFADNYASNIALGAAGELLRKGQQEEAVAAKYLSEYEFKKGKMIEELKERAADWSKTVTDVVGNRLDFSDTLIF